MIPSSIYDWSISFLVKVLTFYAPSTLFFDVVVTETNACSPSLRFVYMGIFAATAVLGVTTAFAANPFSDVTPDSWAYQAVSQLANAGIVNGYPDGTFKGQNNITRYEMAQW